MAIKMDGHIITELELRASNGTTTTKQLTEELNLQEKTATVNGDVTPDAGYDGLRKVIVNVSGGGELPPLTNPASASDILNGKEAIDGNGAKLTGTCTFDADTSDGDATASDIAQGKTAYVNGAKVVGTASGGGETIYYDGIRQYTKIVNVPDTVTTAPGYDQTSVLTEMEEFYANGLSRISSGSLLRVTAPKLKKIYLPKLSDAQAGYIAYSITSLEEVQVGSVGYPFTTSTCTNGMFKGCGTTDVTVYTIYVNANSVAEIDSALHSNITKNAYGTFVFRNSATGEVLS